MTKRKRKPATSASKSRSKRKATSRAPRGPAGSVALRDAPPQVTRRKAGRRSLIHRKGIVEALILAVERGNVLDDAAQVAGIRKTALHAWRKRGEDALIAALDTVPEEKQHTMSFEALMDLVPRASVPYAVFAERMARAISKAKTMVHDRLEGLTALSAHEDPAVKRLALDAIKFMLERRWPRDYGRADRLELSGDESRPVTLQVFLPQLQAGTNDRELMRQAHGTRPRTREGDDAEVIEADN